MTADGSSKPRGGQFFDELTELPSATSVGLVLVETYVVSPVLVIFPFFHFNPLLQTKFHELTFTHTRENTKKT